MARHILFLTPYPHGAAGSQRFRFEQYYDALQAQGFTITKQAFLSNATWAILYKPGFTLQKILGTLGGYIRRWATLFTLAKYDYVFIHREGEPFGPPMVEWIIAKLWRKKIIYDFDDAIWIPNTSGQNGIFSKLKRYGNVPKVCGWAFKVSCGNAYLQSYATQFNPNAVYNPTTIDTANHHNKIKDQNTPTFVIGWTGTHSTLKYLDELVPVLAELEKSYTFEFNVIADHNPQLPLKSFTYTPWRKETEITDLLHFNIGLMPLVNDQWAEGKCGFKALQYMALGVPALVSPVGVNTQIVDNAVNGYVCTTPTEWKNAIVALLTNKQHLQTLAANTRNKIVNHYSVQSNTANFISLFN